jgi:hypothetical protein
MVWGQEFFEKLVDLLNLSTTLPRSTIAKQSKTLFSSNFSEMIKTLNPSDPLEVIILENSENSENSENPKPSNLPFPGLPLGHSTYYIINSNQIQNFHYPFENSMKMNKAISGFSFFQLLLGVKFPLKVGENLAAVILPGPEFQEPRFPIHFKVTGEGQVQAVLGKCGDEEIVKYNENDFILFFHEHCEEGPQVWMLGFDLEFDYEIEMNIDIVGMIISMLRDLRLHVFTVMFYFEMIEMMAEYEKKFALNDFFMQKTGVPKEVCISFTISAVFLMQFGQRFRNLAMGYLVGFVSDEKIGYKVLDLMFLVCVGFALKTLFGLLFKLLEKMNEKLRRFDKICLALVPLFYFFPWPCLLLALVVSDVSKDTFKVAFIAVLAVLPQNIGWHIAFFTHGIQEFDLYALPVFVFVIVGRFSKVKYRGEVAISCFVLGIFVHDHLFKVAILFEGFCVLASIRHAAKFIKKSFRIKEN